MGDLSNDLKVHQPMFSNHRDVVKLPSDVRGHRRATAMVTRGATLHARPRGPQG
jgi:hypothetical protein